MWGKRSLPFFVISILFYFFSGIACYAQSDDLYFDNFTIEDGLSNNLVHCVFQDSKGWIWFGTNQGVNRFNGYKFTAFQNNPFDSTSLAGLLVRVIFEDNKGNLWVGTESGGLNLFDKAKERFTRVLTGSDSKSIGNSVKTIVQDNKGLLWIGTNAGLKSFNPANYEVHTYLNSETDVNTPGDNYVRVLQTDLNGKIWLGTNAGPDILDPSTGKFTRLSAQIPDLKDEIWELYLDTDGKIWIGTYNNGVFIVDPNTYQYKRLLFDENKERGNTVRAIIHDRKGIYWIGTRGGLYRYDIKTGQSFLSMNDERESKSLIHNSVLDLMEDKKGDIWVTTRGGVSLMVREKQVFSHYKALPNDTRYLNDNEIYAIWSDNTGNIWLGTDKGGVNILNRKTKTFSYLTKEQGGAKHLTSNCIKAFMEDGIGNVWIGTFRGGINVYNLKSKQISYLRNDAANPNSLSDDMVWALLRDKKGAIWIGTNSNLDWYDTSTRKFQHFSDVSANQPIIWMNEDSEGDLWLGQGTSIIVYRPNFGVLSRFNEQGRWFYQDTKGRCWLATIDKGLALYDKKKGPLKYYDERSGIANNQSLSIIEDYAGCLWIGTANGLSRFNPETYRFTNFDRNDGLQNNQFLYGAAYKAPTGELLFGGISGFNIFNPRNVTNNPYIPPVVFSDLKIFNKSVEISDAEDAILTSAIDEIKKITLPFDQNILTIDFAALNYAQSNKNQYRYKLEGFEKNWTESGNQRSATYTNLNPGIYTFRVLASNNNGIWNKQGTSLSIEILPPFWKTWWFKIFVALAFIAIVYLLIIFIVNREKLRHELVFERVKAKKMHELDSIKLRFFTNISHEIRTPLTLIIGPLERMLQSDMPQSEVKNHLAIMQRNANQLLKLINQLLDFRKLETGNLKLELSKGDIVSFVSDIVSSFSDLANEKGIKLKCNAVNAEVFTFFDPDKLEKIMNNLLSNAMKFTDSGGSVSVNVSMLIDDSESHNGEAGDLRFIEIAVKDTGIGIPPASRERIFTRFFQLPTNKTNTGTGIGLSLTRELVKLHGGNIFVESKQGKGTKFTVRIPYTTEVFNEVNSPGASTEKALGESDMLTYSPVLSPEYLSDQILLIIEDNADVRYFIRSNFEPEFKVYEAADGKDGFNQALKLIPDIIISDVMMPGMDGNELCKKLKKDERTSHVPIIMLTALTSKENTLEGLASGADDYITKPFDINILRTKVENMLSLRKTFREKFSGEMVLQPTKITITSPDEKFLRKAIEIVEKNIGDPDLDIEKFSDELGVSRMQLYRKLAALTDMTVKEFIRDIRLKRATQLLTERKLTISEIAYSIGFRDLSHFRKCFREEFGMSATEYIARLSETMPDKPS
jgi:signal transduction histidine kinase/ligand-binding sensor domain-containing protein/AraC-like DNA-binding protein